MSYVYLIRAGDSDVYKIGVSRSPQRRMASIQMASHQKLQLVKTWKLSDPHAVERAAHKGLKSVRLQGEWFFAEGSKVEAAILASIQQINKVYADKSRTKKKLPLDPSVHRKRTLAGLAAARARGRIGGRRSVYSDADVLEAAKLGTLRGMKKLGMKSKAGFLRRLKQAQEAQQREQA